MIPLRTPVKHPGAAPEKDADTAMKNASALIFNLLRCVVFLIRNRIHVVGFEGWRGNHEDHIKVRVTANPKLYSLFHGECGWHVRRQEGALTRFTYVAVHSGIRIEWEEVACVH